MGEHAVQGLVLNQAKESLQDDKAPLEQLRGQVIGCACQCSPSADPGGCLVWDCGCQQVQPLLEAPEPCMCQLKWQMDNMSRDHCRAAQVVFQAVVKSGVGVASTPGSS